MIVRINCILIIIWKFVFIDVSQSNECENTSDLMECDDLKAGSNDDRNLFFKCLPTSKTTTVHLYVYEGRHPVQVNVNEEMFVLDGRMVTFGEFGFVLHNSSIRDMDLRAYCLFQSDSGDTYKTPIYKIYRTDKTTIIDENDGNVMLGADLKLSCRIKLDPPIPASLEWKTNTTSNRIEQNSVELEDETLENELLIRDVTKEDEGLYTCIHESNDETQVFISVIDKSQAYIRAIEVDGLYTQEKVKGDYVKWRFFIKSFPKPTIKFLDLFGNEIINGSKKTEIIIISQNRVILRKDDLVFNDTGEYQVIVTNGFSEPKKIRLKLIVNDYPRVTFHSEEYVTDRKNISLNCEIIGNPIPTFRWIFQPCPDGSEGVNNCKNTTLSQYTDYDIVFNQTKYSVSSHLIWHANESGSIYCIGENFLGRHEVKRNIFISEVEHGFGLKLENEVITVGDNVTIKCYLSIYKNISNSLQLYDVNNRLIEIDSSSNDSIVLRDGKTNCSNILELQIMNIDVSQSGDYKCRYINGNREETEKVININVHEISPPVINKSVIKNDEDIELFIGPQEREYCCEAVGYPPPEFTWFKDNIQLSNPNNVKKISYKKSCLKFFNITDDDDGFYKCITRNDHGMDQLIFHLNIMNQDRRILYVSIIFLLLIAFVFITIFLMWKIKREREIKKELMLAGLYRFIEGDTKCLNPDLGIDEQADLLPYDKKWEFPCERLKLGTQLGSGAFGVVMKAKAYGIIEGEEVSTVAVKMVKKTADAAFIKALASELKIMVHLGKHLNVVNLLGACTNNVSKRELLVIVEYCKFGNIHNYLLRQKTRFINQIVPETDTIDITIGLDILSRTYSVSSSGSDRRKTSTHSNEFRRSEEYNAMLPLLTRQTSRLDDVEILSNGSVQPLWRSNYRADYNYANCVKPVTTQDLVCWAFQVASGMEYLASRKVLHGDLAARNILLADDNVVKICDFGLARNMYKDGNYKKKSSSPMPLKWMAIESIQNGIFSTQSDVWSFGVVMWEMFTLSEVPYAGIQVDEHFCDKLKNGLRLRKPEYATSFLYEMMEDCWRLVPLNRPTFTDLAMKLANYLDNGIIHKIMELNEPYVEMNNKWMTDKGDNDYLAMVSAPDYNNVMSDVVYESDGNDCLFDLQTGDNNYLPMNTDLSTSLSRESSQKDQVDITDFKLESVRYNRHDSGVGGSIASPLYINSPLPVGTNPFNNNFSFNIPNTDL